MLHAVFVIRMSLATGFVCVTLCYSDTVTTRQLPKFSFRLGVVHLTKQNNMKQDCPLAF